MTHALERRIPNHFLVIALIKQLCTLYIEDADKRTETFNGTVQNIQREIIFFMTYELLISVLFSPLFLCSYMWTTGQDESKQSFHSIISIAMHACANEFALAGKADIMVTRLYVQVWESTDWESLCHCQIEFISRYCQNLRFMKISVLSVRNTLQLFTMCFWQLLELM